MAETKTDEQDQAESEGKGTFGRVLDIAGICAGVLLGVIIFDVVSGGKITRVLSRKPGPCQDCADKATVQGEAVSDS